MRRGLVLKRLAALGLLLPAFICTAWWARRRKPEPTVVKGKMMFDGDFDANSSGIYRSASDALKLTRRRG